MRLTRESESKKKKQPKEQRKHTPAYLRGELHEQTLADLFAKKGK